MLQWKGTKEKPLVPDTVFREIAALLTPYGVDTLETDQFAFDFLTGPAERHGLTLVSTSVTAQMNLEDAERLKTLLQETRLELPPDPAVKGDLLLARKRLTQTGPRLFNPTTADGRHGDYLSALGRALANPPEMPAEPEKPMNHMQRLLERDRIEQATDHWERIGQKLVGRV